MHLKLYFTSIYGCILDKIKPASINIRLGSWQIKYMLSFYQALSNYKSFILQLPNRVMFYSLTGNWVLSNVPA